MARKGDRSVKKKKAAGRTSQLESWAVSPEEPPIELHGADVMAPEQFRCRYASSLTSPERALAAAVLNQAVADFQKYLLVRDVKGTQRFAEVERWLRDNNSEWVFSFANCCAALGIDAAYLRKGLMAWKKHRLLRTGSLTKQAA